MLLPTYSGVLLDPFDLRVEQVDRRDIAGSLSMQCRFVGALPFFYSVADHSRRVCGVLRAAYPDRNDLHLQGLLHDASEAYLGDVRRPLKASRLFDEYRALEATSQSVVLRAFGLPPALAPVIHLADNAALYEELRVLLGWPQSRINPAVVRSYRAMQELGAVDESSMTLTESLPRDSALGFLADLESIERERSATIVEGELALANGDVS